MSLYVQLDQHEWTRRGEPDLDVLLFSILEDKQLEPIGRVHLSPRLDLDLRAAYDKISARLG